MLVRRIVGDSMLPALQPADIILARRSAVKAGDIVIATVQGREVIKRVTHVNLQGVFLAGDNPTKSTDSRSYGLVKTNCIKATMILRFRPRGGRRTLARKA